MHPDIQHAAHKELDHVVGNDRLPVLEDRDSLPFVTAIVWEVLRFVGTLLHLYVELTHVLEVASRGTPRCVFSTFFVLP